MTDFVDMVNNQEFNPDDYWVTYIHINIDSEQIEGKNMDFLIQLRRFFFDDILFSVMMLVVVGVSIGGIYAILQ